MALSMALAALSLGAFAAAGASTSVLDAVASKDKAALRTLLKNGADVNAAMGDGLTAIHQVAIDGDTELAQLLIYAGANLKATTRLGGYTPLLLAAKNGDAAMIETLLKGGADPNQATTNGTSPLMFAAASGNVAAVKTLLDKGADIAGEGEGHGPDPADVRGGERPGRCGEAPGQPRRRRQGHDQGRGSVGVHQGSRRGLRRRGRDRGPGDQEAGGRRGEGRRRCRARGSAAKPDAATEAAKAAGLGGATTLSAPVNAPATKTAEKSKRTRTRPRRKRPRRPPRRTRRRLPK